MDALSKEMKMFHQSTGSVQEAPAVHLEWFYYCMNIKICKMPSDQFVIYSEIRDGTHSATRYCKDIVWHFSSDEKELAHV